MSNGKNLIYHYSVLSALIVVYKKYIIYSDVYLYNIILYTLNRNILFNGIKLYFLKIVINY